MLFIPDKKRKYKDSVIVSLPNPEMFHIPLYGYRGELETVVQKGDPVYKYQLLARGAMNVCVHAPVSGIVGDVLRINQLPYLQLINDFKDQEQLLGKSDPQNISLEQFIRTLSEYGIEGSGGARFPTSLKYQIGERQIETFIINGAECEPYLSADYALMKQYSQELAQTAALIQRLIGIDKVVLGIEKQHKQLKPLFEKAFAENYVNGGVQLLPDTYPQGGELQLIRSVTGKVIAKGRIPADYGIIVNNVGTLWAIYQAVFENKPYVERLITLYDEIQQKGENHWVRIGTPVSYLSAKFFSVLSNQVSFILGGPMMGKPVENTEQSVDKGTGGLILLKKTNKRADNCIDCGYCVEVCPQQLMPLEFARNYYAQDKKRLRSYHLTDCIECGACAYICPSDVPLMLSIREGKKLIID